MFQDDQSIVQVHIPNCQVEKTNIQCKKWEGDSKAKYDTKGRMIAEKTGTRLDTIMPVK